MLEDYVVKFVAMMKNWLESKNIYFANFVLRFN